MLQNRIIPVLLLGKSGLVKTTGFAKPKYVGDPINAVKLFNDKEVDELVLLDIEATSRGAIQFDLLEQIASEAFMPVTYGGGIRQVGDVSRLLRLGVEKIIINTALYQQPSLLSQIAVKFGSTTVIASVDFKKDFFGTWKPYSNNGKVKLKEDVQSICKRYESEGAGELLLHCIGYDGQMQGYPIDILKQCSEAVSIPVIACGGAGSLEDMASLAKKTVIKAFAAGSLFIYYGPHKAVLINYPTPEKLRLTFGQ
jgi:cyclase